MVINSSMFNEKQTLQYQVELYKDLLDEHYQTFQQIKRQLKEKSRVRSNDLLDEKEKSFS